MDTEQPLDGALDPQEKLKKKKKKRSQKNTFRCNTSSWFECVWISGARVIHATTSFQKAEQSAWSLSNDDTRMPMASPPSQSLPAARFQTKQSAHVDRKRCVKEENPTVSRWVSSRRHGWYSHKMSRAKCLIIPI